MWSCCVCVLFLVRNDFISISCFLQHLPLKSQQEQSDFFMYVRTLLAVMTVSHVVYGCHSTVCVIYKLSVCCGSIQKVQAVLAGSQVASGTHAELYLRPSDIGCQYSRSIYAACFIVWQSRCAADMSTNWWQNFFCCSTASMEQATDGAETAAIDGIVSL